MMLSDDEQLTLDAVREIQSIKRENRKRPDFAWSFEIYNYLRYEIPEQRALQALRSLYRRGLLEFHKDVNGNPMFGILNKNSND